MLIATAAEPRDTCVGTVDVVTVPSGSAVVFGTGSVAVAVVASRLARAGVPVTLVSHSPRATERLQRGVHVVSGDADGVSHSIVRPERVLCMDDLDSVSRAVAAAPLIVVATSTCDDVGLASTLRAGLVRRSVPTTVLVCTNSPDGAGRLGRLVVGTDVPASHTGTAFAGVLVDQIVTNGLGSRGAPTLRSERARPLLIESSTAESFPVPLPDSMGTAHFTEALAAKLSSFSVGHAATAYLGAVRGHRRIDSALADPEVRLVVREAIAEGTRSRPMAGARHSPAGDPGCEWAGVGPEQGTADGLFARYANPVLCDTVERVGRDPLRKLARDDRICGPALHAVAAGHPANALAVTAAAALMALRADCSTPAWLRGATTAEVLSAVAQLPADHEFVRRVSFASGVLMRTRSPMTALAHLRGHGLLLAGHEPPAHAHRWSPTSIVAAS